jgi:hypothetical protein
LLRSQILKGVKQLKSSSILKTEGDARPPLVLATSNPRPGRSGPLTARQESFCVAVASGADLKVAFLANYIWNGDPEGLGREAGRKKRHPRLAARICELRSEYARHAIEASRGRPEPSRARAYTSADAMAELDRVMELATSNENPLAMIRVIEVRMKLYGLGIGEAMKPSHTNAMTPEQIEAALTEVRELRAERRRLE